MQKEEIQNLITNGNISLKKQESIKILQDYVSFLTEIGEQEELLLFVEEQLIKFATIECYFGKKIYSLDDITEFFTHHKELINKKLRKIFLSSRDSVITGLYSLYYRKMWTLFDIVMQVLQVHHGESFEIVDAWLNEAIDDIKGARRDLRANAYKKALNRLQRAVEVLIKAYALYIGLKTEDELRKDIRHTPIEVYVDLLNQSWVVKAKNVFKIKSDVKSSIQYLEKLKLFNKSPEDITKNALEWDTGVPFFLKQYEKINLKLNNAFSKRSINYLLKYCEGNIDAKAFHKAWFGFSALLLPLSVSTQYYSSRFVYPDFSRKLDIDYKDTNLIKNLNRICYLLEDNIKFLKNSFRQDKKFSYTFLCETLLYLLPDINHLYSDEEKLKIINKTVESIKSDHYIMQLISKIKNSDTLREATSYGILS